MVRKAVMKLLPRYVSSPAWYDHSRAKLSRLISCGKYVGGTAADSALVFTEANTEKTIGISMKTPMARQTAPRR
jgi:hypothetical protein